MKWLAGALLGGVLASVPFAREADAAPCPSGSVKCFGTCCVQGQICANKGAGASCQCPNTGEIVCPSGPGGQQQCTNILTNPNNCGNCGVECPAGSGQVCSAGQCVCPSGTTQCGGSCVSTCTGGQVLNNNCQCVCPSGTTQCGGECISTNCPGGQVLNESCQCACPQGSQLCNLTGNCVTPACQGGTAFNPATCQCECANGFTLCGGNCVANCSEGRVLDQNCACVCPTGFTECGGSCVSACTGGQVLNNNCQCVCPQGSQFCQVTGNCQVPNCPGDSVFNPVTCQCEGGTGCRAPGETCTSKNECCVPTGARTVKCERVSGTGNKVCVATF